MSGMNGVPPGLAVLGLPPHTGASADYLGGMAGGMAGGLQAGLVGGLVGGAGAAVGLSPGTAALPAPGMAVPGMLGSGMGAQQAYCGVPLSAGTSLMHV